MSLSTRRKFKTYMSLTVALRKQNFTTSGRLATLLLECFMEDGGRLLASQVVARGLCEEGFFHAWRDDMVKRGLLIWSVNQADKGQYYPGKKLVQYINKEKLASKEIVTRDDIIPKESLATKDDLEKKADKSDLEKTKLQLQETQKRMEEIAVAVQEIQKAMIPPVTPKKKVSMRTNTEKIARLVTVQ